MRHACFGRDLERQKAHRSDRDEVPRSCAAHPSRGKTTVLSFFVKMAPKRSETSDGSKLDVRRRWKSSPDCSRRSTLPHEM